jgi:hypothetical protein
MSEFSPLGTNSRQKTYPWDLLQLLPLAEKQNAIAWHIGKTRAFGYSFLSFTFSLMPFASRLTPHRITLSARASTFGGIAYLF